MTTVTHAYTVAISDRAEDAAAGKVLPSHWNADHTVSYAGGTVTASAPIIDATQTWNSGAVTFVGFRWNITNTASAASSLVADWQVGGSSKFVVRVDGNVGIGTSSPGAPLDVNGNIYCRSIVYANQFSSYSGAGLLWALPAGEVSRFYFGDTASSTQFELQDVSANAIIEVKANQVITLGFNSSCATTLNGTATFNGNILTAGGNGSYVQTPSMTVTNLAAAGTAGAGARAFVTDATATTFLSVVAGGGANKVPVVSDGTNWLIG